MQEIIYIVFLKNRPFSVHLYVQQTKCHNFKWMGILSAKKYATSNKLPLCNFSLNIDTDTTNSETNLTYFFSPLQVFIFICCAVYWSLTTRAHISQPLR